MLSVWKNTIQTKASIYLFAQLFLIEGHKSRQTEKICKILCVVEENLDFGLTPSIVIWLLQCAVNLWSAPLPVSPNWPHHKSDLVAWIWVSDKGEFPVEIGHDQSCVRGLIAHVMMESQKIQKRSILNDFWRWCLRTFYVAVSKLLCWLGDLDWNSKDHQLPRPVITSTFIQDIPCFLSSVKCGSSCPTLQNFSRESKELSLCSSLYWCTTVCCS